jgi:uncharacterized protein (TIGR01777 family)
MNNSNQHILIAGGTGLIGKTLEKQFLADGFEVSILTRNEELCKQAQYRWWNPDAGKMSPNALDGIDIVVNLCGAGIADKPWTAKRKEELHDSRVKPALLLLDAAKKSGKIKHYISASGINCYTVNTPNQVNEDDAYGTDYLSRLVHEWEYASLQFEALCPVTLLRISAVLSENGGALKKLKPLFKWGLGSPLGTGKQPFTWVHEKDLVRAILHITENQLAGAYNICGKTVSNELFSKALAKSVKRWMLPIGVPAFLMKLMLGEMSEMLLNGVNTNAEKLKSTGFEFKFEEIGEALS